MKRALIYARLSVAREESVSLERQLQAGRALAESRGWKVLGEATDEGLSATRTRPEDRPGWAGVLAHPDQFDAVIVWKVDRLARRVLDFLHADEALQRRGAGLVCVEDPIDMTSPQGRAFATVLAVFGEMEAAAVSARVKAARAHLLKAGRVVGGTVPYGWRAAPNPDGPGLVLARDPERIEWVRGMAQRAIRGETVYAIRQWLDDAGAPIPTASQATRKHAGWSYTTVERLLRNPVLAGMTAYQPGRGRHDAADPSALLRDEQGMPIVDDSVAVISPEERLELLARLDTRQSAQSRPRSSRGVTTPLLSGMLLCADCERTLHRGTTQGRPSLSCPKCHQTVSRRQLDEYLTERLLAERGEVLTLASESAGAAPDLRSVEAAIRDLTGRLADDDANEEVLLDQIRGLKAQRAASRATAPAQTWKVTGRTVRQAWVAAEGDDVARREILAQQLQELTLARGKPGRYLDRSRVSLTWKPVVEVTPLRLRVADPGPGRLIRTAD